MLKIITYTTSLKSVSFLVLKTYKKPKQCGNKMIQDFKKQQTLSILSLFSTRIKIEGEIDLFSSPPSDLFLFDGASTFPAPLSSSSSSSPSWTSSSSSFSSSSKSLASSSSSARLTGRTRYSVPKSSYRWIQLIYRKMALQNPKKKNEKKKADHDNHKIMQISN